MLHSWKKGPVIDSSDLESKLVLMLAPVLYCASTVQPLAGPVATVNAMPTATQVPPWLSLMTAKERTIKRKHEASKCDGCITKAREEETKTRKAQKMITAARISSRRVGRAQHQ